MSSSAPNKQQGLRDWWKPDAHNERRSLTLCIIGAVLGLAIAGVGLFSARGTRFAGVPPEDVAIVNQSPILLSDYEAQLRSLYNVSLQQATPAQKRTTLDGMIREELYVQRGVELGLQNDFVEVRTALVSAVESQQEIDANATVPTEQELRDFYQRHIDHYLPEGVMTVTDYVASDMAGAQRAVSAVRGGGDAPRVLAAAGLQSSGATDDGEEFYFAAALHLGPQLFAVAKRLRDGEISEPVQVGGRIHVLLMHKHQPPVAADFADARDRVLADYRADKIERLRTGTNRFLRERADVQVAEGFQ